ncbi:TPA: hypothetical protein ACGB3K_005110 [Klebsiella aerogenes]
MGLFIGFIISLILCFIVCRKMYRKQLLLQPTNKMKAVFVSGFITFALFIIINTVTILTVIPDDNALGSDAQSMVKTFDEVTTEKFIRLYNDDLGGIEMSKRSDLSTIKISGHELQGNEASFTVGHGVSGRAKVDKNGQITNIYWTIKKTDALSLLSMASVIEVLDSTMDRDSATKFLIHSIENHDQENVNLSTESKKVSYGLIKPKDEALTLHLVPKF